MEQYQYFSISHVIDCIVFLLFFLPEGQVFLEKFYDAFGITEIVLFEFVDLVESSREGIVSKLDGFGLVFHNFVVENRLVENEAKLDRVARS